MAAPSSRNIVPLLPADAGVSASVTAVAAATDAAALVSVVTAVRIVSIAGTLATAVATAPLPAYVVQSVVPVSTTAAGAWTAQPSGTLHGVTADISDTTYAQLLDGDDPSTMILAFGSLEAPGGGGGTVTIRTRMV